MYVILQLQHSVGDVSNSTSSTVQSLTELVVFFFWFIFVFIIENARSKKQNKKERTCRKFGLRRLLTCPSDSRNVCFFEFSGQDQRASAVADTFCSVKHEPSLVHTNN